MQQRVFALVANKHRGVAFVAGKVAAYGQAHIADLAVGGLVAGNLEARSIQGVVDIAFLLVVVEAVVDIELNALETIIHDEVDHPGQGIGAIDG